MIKAKMRLADDRPLYVFGLSARNVELLQEGKPLRVDLAELGGTGEVLVMVGRTEADIAAELCDFIGPDTQVHGLPPG